MYKIFIYDKFHTGCPNLVFCKDCFVFALGNLFRNNFLPLSSEMTKLQTKNIKLRPLALADVSRLAEIANNRNISINHCDAFPFPYTEMDAENFILNCMKQNPTTIFAIEYDGIYVGNIGLVIGTDVYRKSVEIGYFIDEPYWNKGIVSQAVNLITAYGFETLDIVRIHTGVFDYNLSSQRVLEKCGYKKEGTFRNAVFKDGRICDEIRFSKLKTDYDSIKLINN